MQNVAGNKNLKVLSCANCHLTDTFGTQFAEALKTNVGLTKFNFSGNEMTSKTLQYLAIALEKNVATSLVEINLSKNNLNDKVDDKGGINVKDKKLKIWEKNTATTAAPLDRVKELSSFTAVKTHLNSGAIKFGEALRYSHSLKKINLSDNNLTDDTALAINRSIKVQKSIEEMDLSKNLINISVLETLALTLSKIRDYKVKAEIPNKMKIKLGFAFTVNTVR